MAGCSRKDNLLEINMGLNSQKHSSNRHVIVEIMKLMLIKYNILLMVLILLVQAH